MRVGVVALPATPAGCAMRVNDVHTKLGHCSEAQACKAVRIMIGS